LGIVAFLFSKVYLTYKSAVLLHPKRSSKSVQPQTYQASIYRDVRFTFVGYTNFAL